MQTSVPYEMGSPRSSQTSFFGSLYPVFFRGQVSRRTKVRRRRTSSRRSSAIAALRLAIRYWCWRVGLARLRPLWRFSEGSIPIREVLRTLEERRLRILPFSNEPMRKTGTSIDSVVIRHETPRTLEIAGASMYSATRGNDGCVLHHRRRLDRAHIIRVRIEDSRTGIASGPPTLVLYGRSIWRTMLRAVAEHLSCSLMLLEFFPMHSGSQQCVNVSELMVRFHGGSVVRIELDGCLIRRLSRPQYQGLTFVSETSADVQNAASIRNRSGTTSGPEKQSLGSLQCVPMRFALYRMLELKVSPVLSRR